MKVSKDCVDLVKTFLRGLDQKPINVLLVFGQLLVGTQRMKLKMLNKGILFQNCYKKVE